MKEREEKAEVDIVIITLKVTYHCVCEGSLRKMRRNRKRTKRVAAEKNVVVAAGR